METAAIYLLTVLYILLNIIDLIQAKTLLCTYGSEAEANFIVNAIVTFQNETTTKL